MQSVECSLLDAAPFTCAGVSFDWHGVGRVALPPANGEPEGRGHRRGDVHLERVGDHVPRARDAASADGRNFMMMHLRVA